MIGVLCRFCRVAVEDEPISSWILSISPWIIFYFFLDTFYFSLDTFYFFLDTFYFSLDIFYFFLDTFYSPLILSISSWIPAPLRSVLFPSRGLPQIERYGVRCRVYLLADCCVVFIH